MQENRKNLLKSVYTVCFSVLTVVVGLLFIMQAWTIFRSAERGAFTRASVADHFKQIAAPVFFWVVALIGNIVLGYIYPDKKEKVKPYFEAKDRIKRLQKRLPKNAESLHTWTKADVFGVAVGCIAAEIAWIALFVSAIFLFTKNYAPILSEPLFVEHNAVTDRLLRVLIWCGGAIMMVTAAVIFNEYLAKKKETRIKREIAQNALQKKGVPAVQAETKKQGRLAGFFQSAKFLWGVRAVVGVVGIVFVISGICNGGMADVLKKAINLCTQCIGLG